MSEFENNEAMELSIDELGKAAGGDSRFSRLPAKAGFIIYKVQKGDSLGKIAIAFHCTVPEIMSWNPKITDKSCIYADEYLYIRA